MVLVVSSVVKLVAIVFDSVFKSSTLFAKILELLNSWEAKEEVDQGTAIYCVQSKVNLIVTPLSVSSIISFNWVGLVFGAT